MRDQAEFIEASIESVQSHLVIGSALAALVVLLFLGNLRSTMIAAISIPTSIIATFGLVRYMDFTLNMLTMLALTLAVGIVIDDAIVVLENIYRFIEEKGMPPAQAAVEATKEIGLAVLATTMSLVAIFVPVGFMSGMVGRFMQSFGLTMAFAIMVSLARELHPDAHDVRALVEAEGRPQRRRARLQAVDDLRSGGSHLRPHARLGDGAQGCGGRAGRPGAPVERPALPDRERQLHHAGRSVGIRRHRSRPRGHEPRRDAVDGQSVDDGDSTDSRRSTTHWSRWREMGPERRTVASIFVKLVPIGARDRDQFEIMAEVREEIVSPLVAQGIRASVGGGGGGGGGGVQYVLQGPEVTELKRYSGLLLAKVKTIPGVVDADTNLNDGKPELSVRMDRPKAADLGVPLAEAADALRLLVGGDAVTTYNEAGEQYEVHVRARTDDRDSEAAIGRLPVPSRLGPIALENVASFASGEAPSDIRRLSRQRQVTVTVNLLPGTSQATVQDEMTAAAEQIGLSADYSGGFSGQSRELNRTATAFLMAFALSLIFMYLVLAAQFESWLHPVTILLSLPLTLPFALLSLIIFQQSLNVFSALGLLVLFGVVKKNSILQIDRANQLKDAGLSTRGRHRAGVPRSTAADSDDDAGVRRRHGAARRDERSWSGDQPCDWLGGHRRTDARARADAGRHASHLHAVRRPPRKAPGGRRDSVDRVEISHCRARHAALIESAGSASRHPAYVL